MAPYLSTLDILHFRSNRSNRSIDFMRRGQVKISCPGKLDILTTWAVEIDY
jgi:hypothetical protein